MNFVHNSFDFVESRTRIYEPIVHNFLLFFYIYIYHFNLLLFSLEPLVEPSRGQKPDANGRVREN